jgi:hypothetical protein
MSSPQEQLLAPQPTQDVLKAAAETIKPLLPLDFYGKVVIVFEAGRAQRVEIQQSIKL